MNTPLRLNNLTQSPVQVKSYKVFNYTMQNKDQMKKFKKAEKRVQDDKLPLLSKTHFSEFSELYLLSVDDPVLILGLVVTE